MIIKTEYSRRVAREFNFLAAAIETACDDSVMRQFNEISEQLLALRDQRNRLSDGNATMTAFMQQIYDLCVEERSPSPRQIFEITQEALGK